MMLKLHHTKEMENGKTQRKLLTQCQESAITIGTILEEKVEEAVKIVPLLEMYCEEVYVLAESAGTGEKIDLEYADGMLYDVINAIEELQEVYQIVFMPYKAAMWDALESIYLAAKDDVGCEALVVPVPYYSFDQKRKNGFLIMKENCSRQIFRSHPIRNITCRRKDRTLYMCIIHMMILIM